MRVSLMYFDGCPNHRDTLTVLNGLLDDAGWEGTVHLVNVDSAERATELDFRGSPTVLIDGVDPFLDNDAPTGLTCRIYRTSNGFQGMPPVQQLRDAIQLSMDGNA